MPNGDHKPGYALADHLREQTERLQRETQAALDEAKGDGWNDETHPTIVVVKRSDSEPPSGRGFARWPVVGPLIVSFPRAWRPWLGLGVLLGILLGGGSQWAWLRALLGFAP